MDQEDLHGETGWSKRVRGGWEAAEVPMNMLRIRNRDSQQKQTFCNRGLKAMLNRKGGSLK